MKGGRWVIGLEGRHGDQNADAQEEHQVALELGGPSHAWLGIVLTAGASTGLPRRRRR
jgi:hypothetical protein